MNNIEFNDFLSLLTDNAKEELLKDSELAMEGLLVLPGTEGKPYFVGNPPKWDENKVGVGGYTWMLSRLNHLETLCKAFIATGEEKYIQKVLFDLENWLDTTPTPPIPTDLESALVYHGVHNWRMLELGYRMTYTIPSIVSILKHYDPARFLMDRMRNCIIQHGERLAAGSHLLWPNKDHNHYLEEITGLMGVTALIPDYEKSEEWSKQAMNGLIRCCEVQISDDGGQIEGCPLYHNAALKNLLIGYMFGQNIGIEFPKTYIAKLEKSLDYSIHTIRPTGEAVTLGDTDPDYRSVESAICGYLLLGNSKWLEHCFNFLTPDEILSIASRVTWGFPNVHLLVDFVKNYEADEKLKCLHKFNYQRELDQVLVRTSWDKNALYLAFSCKSPIHYGNHGHIDPLNFDFTAYGKNLIVDPGRYTYKDGEERHMIKSSAMHNMPTLGGRDAFEYISTFQYGKQEEGGIVEVFDTPEFKGAKGYHLNYTPARLERLIGIVEDDILIIVDTFKGAVGETAEIYFNINSMTVEFSDGTIYTNDEDVNVIIASTVDEVKLKDGIISDRFNHSVKSTRAVWTKKITSEDYKIATVVVPQKGKLQKSVDITIQNNNVRCKVGEKEIKIPYIV